MLDFPPKRPTLLRSWSGFLDVPTPLLDVVSEPNSVGVVFVGAFSLLDLEKG